MTEHLARPIAHPYPNPVRAWYVVSVLSTAYCFSFIDRQVLNLLVVPIQADLGISDTEMSFLQGLAFALFYTCLGIPLGRVADRWNRKWLIVAGITIWSFMTVMCGFASNFAELFAARVGVGIGEAALTPAAMSLITDYFPKHRLARAAAVYTAGSTVGAMLAYVVGGLVIDFVSSASMFDLPLFGPTKPWHATFIIVGLPGLAVAVLMITVKEPVRRGSVKVDNAVAHLSLSEVIGFIKERSGAFGGIYFGLSMLIMLNYAINAWMPAFLTRVHGWSPGQLGVVYGLVVFFASVPGVFVGAWLGERLMRSNRKDGYIIVAQIGAAMTIVPCVVAPLMPDPVFTMILMFIGNFFIAFPFGVGPAALQIITPNQMRGQVAAIYVFIVGLVGLGLGPTSVALVTDFAFGDPNKVGWSISIVAAVIGPLSFVLLAYARPRYGKCLDDARAWEDSPD